ncbi:MAG TPA: hypothetical protein VMS01_00050, partial [Stellaceae bacterium]|nr:hypothetical protein [Stellaceae bacterium]
MSFTRLAAMAVAVSALWCAAASAGGPLRPFKHGFWSGGAYTDERTGAFTHCSAGVAYDSGINLFVLVTGGYRWWLGFINPTWSLTPNAKISIKLQLDDGAPFDGPASIPSGQLLLVSLPDSSKLLAAFRRGSKLALDAEGQSFSFKLNGTPAVMDQLANCVRTSVALATQLAPPAPSIAASAKTGVDGASSSPTQPGPSVTSARPSATPAGPATPVTGSSTPPQKADAETAVGSHTLNAASESAATPSATGGAPLGDTTATPPVSTAGPPAPPAETAAPPQPAAPVVSGAERISDRAGEPVTAALSSAPTQPAAPAGDKTEAMAQPALSPAAAPPLAFTSVAPAASTPRSSATASDLPPALATATALEEIRLATDFLTNARL